MRQLMERYDTNKDGKLTFVEVMAAKMKAFDSADTNHDGKLSAQEARALPAMGNRFKQLDTDHDGALSREEFDEGAKP